jgi:hypothetical protein
MTKSIKPPMSEVAKPPQRTDGQSFRWLWWAAPLTAAVTAAVPTYWLVTRPWMLRWQVTDAEVRAAYPGDELIATPRAVWMRAVDIAAPPALVWPWLVQMGQGRGGLYSYDWLENLVGCDIHSVDRIVDAWQQLALGDQIRLVPKGYQPDLALDVRILLPNAALVLESPPLSPDLEKSGLSHMSWAFLLQPTADGGTRLIARTRMDYWPTLGGVLINQIMLEPIQFIMERKMLLGIRARAEKAARTI